MRFEMCPIGYCKAICMVLARWSLAISPRFRSGQCVAEWLEGVHQEGIMHDHSLRTLVDIVSREREQGHVERLTFRSKDFG